MWFLRLPHFRLFFLAAILILQGGGQASGVTLTEDPQAGASTTTATITWGTDVACGTKISYGTSADALTQKAQGDVSGSHSITLSDLQPGTTYFYEVGSARVKLGSGSFTTNGKGTPAPKTTTTTTQKPPPPARRPAAVALKAPATRSTWASVDSLPDHFARHGGDFNAQSKDDYAAQAWLFLQRAKQEGLPMKWDDADSTLRVWDPSKHIFAAYNRAGKTRTFFKPGNPEYWNKQPGRAMRPEDLSF